MATAKSDEQLMIEYSNGDFNAFSLLYERHKGGLYRYFLRQTKDAQQAEDLFQDVWKKVVGSASNYTNQAKFSTWLYTIARNQLIDQVRRLQVVEQVIDTEAQAEQPSQESQAKDPLDNAQAAQAIKHCLSKLPAVQLDSFMLREEGGFNLAEIAEITQTGLEAAKSRLRYAYRSLRDCVTLKLQGAS